MSWPTLCRCLKLTAAFKPKKVAEGTKQWQLKQYAQQTLVSVSAEACGEEVRWTIVTLLVVRKGLQCCLEASETTQSSCTSLHEVPTDRTIATKLGPSVSVLPPSLLAIVLR